MSGVNEIRSAFLNYFAAEGHEIVPSSPLVPRNDPTLMFTNAGMVQFKNVFTGVEKRPYQRATTSQKCVRAGGKHNDLDNVGYTARHLTFFEMLGNFSFGDYFKERAIELAWNLITRDFGLKKDKLLVTVYHTDDEAAVLWKKIAGFGDDRIIRIPTSDNFWAMGDTGPCGPCSEIFIDRGEHIWGGPPGSPEEDGDRFLEFWNLVFMQFEQVTKDGAPAAAASLDRHRPRAGAHGLHPAGRRQHFETDLFRHLIDATASALGTGPEEQNVASFRVIADHLRSSAFLISDGVLPSNEGRGYVLRRIMRRAMRHAQLLGARDPLMHRLVWALVREMGQAYPDLVRAEKLIEETLRLEETRFRKTLERGLVDPRREEQFAEEGRHVRRRYRVHAVRHLWLSARPHPGRAAQPRHQRRSSPRSPMRWNSRKRRRARHGRDPAIPPARTSGFRCARNSARPNFWATRPRPPKAWSQRWSRTARMSRASKPARPAPSC